MKSLDTFHILHWYTSVYDSKDIEAKLKELGCEIITTEKSGIYGCDAPNLVTIIKTSLSEERLRKSLKIESLKAFQGYPLIIKKRG
jgi:hypothetical protein